MLPPSATANVKTSNAAIDDAGIIDGIDITSNEGINSLASAYWQDFIAGRPLAGGIVYEAQLRACQLDESLMSLQRVDIFITQLRRDHLKAGTLDEDLLLADKRYRNLLLFLAFYAARVLAQQWQSTPHWYNQSELRLHCPKMPLITDDFYQQMAVAYHGNFEQGFSHNFDKNSTDEAVFFALEPIGQRLFGSVDRRFIAVQGGQVASGLYQAVVARLPNVAHNQASIGAVIKDDIKAAKQTAITTNIIKNTAELPNKQARVKSELERDETPIPLAKTTAKPSAKPPTPKIFTQLLTELQDIEVTQSAGHDDYQQACKILDQFERHIARQHRPRDQVSFSQHHQAARQQALIILEKAARDGHTGAMLRLAMYELLGEGLSTDSPAKIPKHDKSDKESGKKLDEKPVDTLGVEWVKEAAMHKDSRAQRLLSKLYYQGLGVAQDIDSGKFWLEQAAKSGHPEASTLVAQWQQAQQLITTKQQEQHSTKRYQLLVAAIAIGALLLLILV